MSIPAILPSGSGGAIVKVGAILPHRLATAADDGLTDTAFLTCRTHTYAYLSVSAFINVLAGHEMWLWTEGR
jgi:hypothetical protein